MLVGSVSAQEADPDEVNRIAKQMNCPTCIGVNLADCNTQTCAQWRGQIADLVAQGYSDQEVLDYFVNQHGVQVLLEPPKKGSTLLLWVLPVLAILIGGGWLFYTMQRWNQAKLAPAEATTAPHPSPEVTDDYLSQVEKDLRGKE